MTRIERTRKGAMGDHFEVLLAVGFDVVGAGRLPRVLCKAGCRVSLVSPPGLAVSNSRFVHKHIRAGSRGALVDLLRDHMARHGDNYDLVIIADEPLLNELANQEEKSWLQGWFPVSTEPDYLSLVTSKLAFQEGAARASLPVPRFRTGRTFEKILEGTEEIGFPVVLKNGFGYNGDTVRIAPTVDRLKHAFEDLAEGSSLLVQEFVDGTVGTSETLFDHGVPVCWSSFSSIRSWPGKFNASCIRGAVVHEAIEPLVFGVGELTSFHGLCGVDWIRETGTGKIYLLEFNPRPGPGYHIAPPAGVDFSYGIRTMLRHQPVVQRPAAVSGRAATIHMFPQAMYLAIDERSLPMMLRTVPDIPLDDLGLTRAYFRRLFTHYVPIRLRNMARSLVLGSRHLSSVFKGRASGAVEDEGSRRRVGLK